MDPPGQHPHGPHGHPAQDPALARRGRDDGHDDGRDDGHGRGHRHGHDGHRHAGLGRHSHGAPQRFDRAFVIGIGLNAVFVAVEAVAGWISGSLALLADAGHNLGDVLALALAWAGMWAARLPTSRRRTYGWRRGTILAALINAVMLLAALGAMAWEAVGRLSAPPPVDAGMMVGVASIGIAINAMTAWLFASGQRDDLNLRGAYLHMVADAAVSAGVVVGGLLVWRTGWLWLDPLIGLAIAGIVGVGTTSLLRESLRLAMDAVPDSIDPDAVRRHLLALPGVDSLHDLHIWALSTSGVALTAHLVMPGGHPGDTFLMQASTALRAAFRIDHATLQIETGTAETGCPQDCGNGSAGTPDSSA